MKFFPRLGRKYYFKMFLYLFSLVIIMDVFVQVFIIKSPKVHVVPGFGMVPMDDSIGIWGVEGYGITHYQQNGEVRTPYTGGASVVVLGDSYTEAVQVSDDEKYVSIAESILRNRGVLVDLHNLGWSGRSIADYVYIAESVERIYSPRVVVIQLGPNDFRDAFNASRPNYFTVEDGHASLVHQDNYFQVDTQNLIRNSGLGSLFIYRFKDTLDKFRFKSNTVPEAVPDTINTPSTMESDMILLTIEALQRAYPRAKIVFLMIPGVPVLNADSIAWRNEIDQSTLNILESSTDIPVIYPDVPFQKLFSDKHAFPRGFFNTLPNSGHLNHDGQIIIGAVLADLLEKMFK